MIPNYKTLFHRGFCEAKQQVKLEVLAGRSGAFKPRKLQIDVVSKDTLNFTNIELVNIKCMENGQFGSMGDKSKINTAYFNELRDVNFDVFGASAKQGLIFKFNNPTNEDVLIYISILGDCACADLIGRIRT